MVAQLGVDRAEEAVESRLAAFGLLGLEQGPGSVHLGQAVALVSIEHGKGLEHATGLGVLLAILALDLFVVAFVENRDRGLLALADLSAQCLALAIGHPVG